MSIQVGDIVDVTLFGARPSALLQYEVVKVPSNVLDYWEFEGPNGDTVAATAPVSISKGP